VTVSANTVIVPLQPTEGNTGSCSSIPSLVASGLVPGGQGSNSSGVMLSTLNSFVSVPQNNKLKMPGDFTYEMWVKPTSFNNEMDYFSNGVYNSGIILLQINSTQIHMNINGNQFTNYYAPP